MKRFSERGDEPARIRFGTSLLTRRQFLKLVLVAGTMVAVGCTADEGPDDSEIFGRAFTNTRITDIYDTVQPVPSRPPDPNVLRFFTEHEAATVEALTARILPGDADDPGAREAGVVTYIDNMLAYQDGFPEPVYLDGPQVRLYEGDEPPEDNNNDVIWVAADQIERYGFQSPLTPAEVYRIGLEAVDEYAQEEYGSDFVDLDEDEQDEIIEAMEENEIDGFDPFEAEQFFHVLRRGTMEGMFSDPIYGGNRDMAGWRLVGFPGAQRAFLPTEIQVEGGYPREIWGLADLPHFNYSQPRTRWPAAPAHRLNPRPTGRDRQRYDHGHSHGPGESHGH
jgi:gluconate 2-dehydrogenase gamma chain